MIKALRGGGASFSCPRCGGSTGVRDSRPNFDKTAIRRRRECLTCQERFSTYEVQILGEGITPQDIFNLVTDTTTCLATLETAIRDLKIRLLAVNTAQDFIKGRGHAKAPAVD